MTTTAALRLTVADRTVFAAEAAAVIAETIRSRPRGLLGVATGRTPEPVYLELIRMVGEGLDCSGITLAALDEYVGVAAEDPRSYRQYVMARIAGPLGIPGDRVLLPEASHSTGVDFESRLAARGGVDLQIVGIGRNGHLGFNEPGSRFDSRTRVVALTAETRADNAEFFGGDPGAVPATAVTQGIGTILAARKILLLARGAVKRAALDAALHGESDIAVPASALQRHHAVIVVADSEAAGPRR